MDNVKSVGAYLYALYNVKYSKKMDEMKMHKLMYFSQRESLMKFGELLFEEDFYGWKYGPVLVSVRNEYHKKQPYEDFKYNLKPEVKQLLDDVMNRYGGMSSWKLSSLSHDEFSWKNARKGLSPKDNGSTKLELSAMKVDAAREKAHRRDR